MMSTDLSIGEHVILDGRSTDVRAVVGRRISVGGVEYKLLPSAEHWVSADRVTAASGYDGYGDDEAMTRSSSAS